MKLKWFDAGTVTFSLLGYLFMLAGFAAAKHWVPQDRIDPEKISWSLAVCMVLVLACELCALSTFRWRSLWLRLIGAGVLLSMFALYQMTFLWYVMSGHASFLEAYMKRGAPILSMVATLFFVLYIRRQHRRLVYI